MQNQLYYKEYVLPYEERFQEEENFEIDWHEVYKNEIPFSMSYVENDTRLYHGYEFQISKYTTVFFAANSHNGTNAYVSMSGRETIILTDITANELTSLLKNIYTNPHRLSKDELHKKMNHSTKQLIRPVHFI